MPIYQYQNPKTKEIREVVQRMSEPHEYVADGVTWNRVFFIPYAQVDTMATVNPFDRQDFIKKTARPGMTVGDMWDESKRLSDKRTALLGKDPVKEKTEKDYQHRCGKPHPLS